ncbi:Uncharacterized protein ABJ99_1583 [Pseudomonas syringae pv. cilantro]|uniref:DUF7380 domain-containing protein n=1 Tax=Pseudomonas syringae pv. cilantro TaxID=81035 RepID=A0A0N1JP83_PSESX|nr:MULTISPECIES: hypothetical protein [Pseudomonas syringae group]KPC32731.1 Uncharacterized protein ABJ99_1583 [Pseudomonas syringae pv. cilantro]
MNATDQPDPAQQPDSGMSEQQLQATAAEPDAATNSEPNLFDLELASIEDFQQMKISRLLETIDTLEFYSLDAHFSALSKQALAEGQRGVYLAYRVLMVVCSYHFSVDRHDAFGPRLTRDGMRFPNPADIAGEQSQVLAAIAENIDHPLIRAWVADVAWTTTKASTNALA